MFLQTKPGFVAIKSVDLARLNKKLKENLYLEINILKGMQHPHIVSLIDCQETSAHIHLIMEFCELGDLSLFIKKRSSLHQHEATADMIRKYPNPKVGGLNEVIVRHFLKQIASAIQYLREKNCIHRDLKPQNLLLQPSPIFYAGVNPEDSAYLPHDKARSPVTGVRSLPTLKVADFGFARSLPATSLAETLCGSPLYMAPEILRYEKYDAKADLWSLGTVLYEMSFGKPPFKATNHVELLRKIERSEDKIPFPSEVPVSDGMKKLMRALMKRAPVERLSFGDFFNSKVITEEIPGLVEDDISKSLEHAVSEPAEPTPLPEEGLPLSLPTRAKRLSRASAESNLAESPRQLSSRGAHTASNKAEKASHRHSSGTPPPGPPDVSEAKSKPCRPSMVPSSTAPARQDLHTLRKEVTGAVAQRRQSRDSSSSKPTTPTDRRSIAERGSPNDNYAYARDTRETRERAAQDVAFERDYVVVEKRAVEVNAFADELAASPKIHSQLDAQRGAMVRRATSQGQPTATTGAQVTPSRAIQIASGKRPEQLHQRQSSYERRVRNPTSATSAISKAINMASGRLFGMGFSPPLGIGKGPSPPSYNPFPIYPTDKGSLLMISDGKKAPASQDEDAKAIIIIEETATRSDVVYGFAEVKFQQLVPAAPSVDQGLGLRQAGVPESKEDNDSATTDDGLTVDAVVVLSEEALVLYVKALTLLAHAMDIAGAWWGRKNRCEVLDGAPPRTCIGSNNPGTNQAAVGKRINNVVQWVRGRFNEVLEKAEFVRRKLIDSQKQLPQDHPGHPSNHTAAASSTSSGGLGTSADNVVITSGVSAEQLMYDRALEMSRSAAVNELVGDDLPGCEIAYMTAIRMLEALLDGDADDLKGGNKDGSADPEQSLVQGEDRKDVVKRREYSMVLCKGGKADVEIVVNSIRSRHAALSKKMQVLAKRSSAPAPAPGPISRTSSTPSAARPITASRTPPR